MLRLWWLNTSFKEFLIERKFVGLTLLFLKWINQSIFSAFEKIGESTIFVKKTIIFWMIKKFWQTRISSFQWTNNLVHFFVYLFPNYCEKERNKIMIDLDISQCIFHYNRTNIRSLSLKKIKAYQRNWCSKNGANSKINVINIGIL